MPCLRIYLKEAESISERNICTPKFTAALFIIAKPWEQPECPSVDESLKKMRCIYS